MESEKIIEMLLRALFMKPLVLNINCVPLESDDARIAKRCYLIESVILKDWVRNIIKDAVEQLQKSYDRQIQEDHKVSKLYVALDLSPSYCLLQEPFSYCDGNVEEVANKKLNEIFQPFEDEFSSRGLDLELLLP